MAGSESGNCVIHVVSDFALFSGMVGDEGGRGRRHADVCQGSCVTHTPLRVERLAFFLPGVERKERDIIQAPPLVSVIPLSGKSPSLPQEGVTNVRPTRYAHETSL